MVAWANLKWDLGETWATTVSCFDSAGAIVDLTGAQSVVVTIADPTGNVVTTLGVGEGVTILAPATLGQAQFVVTPAMQTASAITAQNYSYRVRVTIANGSVTDQLRGQIRVLGFPP